MSQLFIKRLSSNAVLPSRASFGAAGYDLSSAYNYTVKARGKELIKTDLCIIVPSGTYGRIAPRSGLAWKHSIDVGAGVIDSDYRGNLGVILFNHSDTDFQIIKGDRIAQLILEKINDAAQIVEMKEDEKNDIVTSTVRGSQGFGSTGK